MNQKEQVLEALQNLITTREDAQKKRVVNRGEDQEGNALTLEWSLTQLHIVATIKDNGLANNSLLSHKLNVSKPAIAKAIKKLLKHHVIIKIQRNDNKKEIFYGLTESGEKLAFIHEQLHEKARNKYLSILEKFDDAELIVIARFLYAITDNMKND